MMQPRPTQTKPNTWKRGGWKWGQGRRCRFQRGWGLAQIQEAKGIPPYPLPWWRWTQLGRLSADLTWELLEIWRDLNIILSSPGVLLLLMSSTIIVQVNLGTIMRKESWRAEIQDSMWLSSEASLSWHRFIFRYEAISTSIAFHGIVVWGFLTSSETYLAWGSLHNNMYTPMIGSINTKGTARGNKKMRLRKRKAVERWMPRLVHARIENLINRYHCRFFKITPRRDIGFSKVYTTYTFPPRQNHVLSANRNGQCFFSYKNRLFPNLTSWWEIRKTPCCTRWLKIDFSIWEIWRESREGLRQDVGHDFQMWGFSQTVSDSVI